ncbi:MAG: D-tyrosyl-tRNA(Tyr) deacylase [Bacteroidetes bacterium]|jgi:D-tyrosyl-tRNA(Tyr) deacylase|nr:D-tyrosyl-tRNA(Tyr) deacylase [Bacteroidota bacterium]HQW46847.1 D-aminoacyl-tRNA deacylase [Chitinophagaceae bacterium]
MRAVIQRVSQASVSIEHQIVGAINTGFVVLLGIEANDNEEDVKWLSAKIVSMRIFNDSQSLMNLALKEVQGDLLLISQFTLFASTKKGNRPSFLQSAKPDIAIPLYKKMIAQLESDLNKPIQTGQFGADMQVNLCNNGPVTIIIDSKNKE